MLKKPKKWGADKAKIEAAKKKLGDLKKKEGKGGGKDFLALVEGTNVFRVLPVVTAASEDFYVEVKTHWNVGPNDERFLCPTMHGGKCPICRQATKELEKVKQLPRGDKRNKAWKEVTGQFPRTSFAMLCLPIEPEEDDNPKVVQLGSKAFKDLLKYYTDAEEHGPILDLDDGRDIIVKKVKTGKKQIDVEYTVELRLPAKSIKVPEEVMEKVTSDGPDLDKIYGEDAMPSFGKIQAAMEGVAYEDDDEQDAGDGEEEEDDEEKQPPKRKSKFKQKGDEGSEEKDEEEEEEESDSESESEEEEEEESESEEEEEETSSKKKPSLRDRLKAKARE